MWDYARQRNNYVQKTGGGGMLFATYILSVEYMIFFFLQNPSILLTWFLQQFRIVIVFREDELVSFIIHRDLQLYCENINTLMYRYAPLLYG